MSLIPQAGSLYWEVLSGTYPRELCHPQKSDLTDAPSEEHYERMEEPFEIQEWKTVDTDLEDDFEEDYFSEDEEEPEEETEEEFEEEEYQYNLKKLA